MSVQAVRRLRGVGEPTYVDESDALTIGDISEDEIEGITPDYQFDGQIVYRASYEYTQEDPWTGEIIENEGTVEFRSDSGLVFVNSNHQTPDMGRIVDELVKEINGSLFIEPVSPQERQIWSFIDSANSILEIELINNGYVENIDDTDISYSEAKSENIPVKRAKLLFNFHIGADSHEVEVGFTDQEILIESSNESKVEYIKQIYESSFHD